MEVEGVEGRWRWRNITLHASLTRVIRSVDAVSLFFFLPLSSFFVPTTCSLHAEEASVLRGGGGRVTPPLAN